MGTPWRGTIETQVSLAFQASNEVANEFKLLFAFDYEGGQGAWPAADVKTALSAVRLLLFFREYGYLLTNYSTLRTIHTLSIHTRPTRTLEKPLFPLLKVPIMWATGRRLSLNSPRVGSTSSQNTRAGTPIGIVIISAPLMESFLGTCGPMAPTTCPPTPLVIPMLPGGVSLANT